MNSSFTTWEDVKNVYQRRAQNYDITAHLYYLIGFRQAACRNLAVDALDLKPGDTVVEIGCATGLNLPRLEQKVGKSGRIISVDISNAMLEEATVRVQRAGWSNVELICSDASSFVFPEPIDGVLSTLALTLEPNFDEVIARGTNALKKGRRWAVMDFKVPSNGLRHLAPILIFLARPFAVSRNLTNRHTWESIDKHLINTTFKELFFGFAYLSVGEAAGSASSSGTSAKKA